MKKSLSGRSHVMPLLCISFLSISVLPREVKAETEILQFASDIHGSVGPDSSFNSIVDLATFTSGKDPSFASAELLGLVGDLADSTDVAIIGAISSAAAGRARVVFVQGNGESDPMLPSIEETGRVNLGGINQNYEIFAVRMTSLGLNDADFSTQVTLPLTDFLTNNPDKVKIVLGHYPLHTLRDDSSCTSPDSTTCTGTITRRSEALFTLLNSWGCKRDIVFLWGHNHSIGYDGAQLLAFPGETIGGKTVEKKLEDGTVVFGPHYPNGNVINKILNFFYVNAGYVTNRITYLDDKKKPATSLPSTTVISVDTDKIEFVRYSQAQGNGDIPTEDITAVRRTYDRAKSYSMFVLDVTGSMSLSSNYVKAGQMVAGKIPAANGTDHGCYALWLLKGDAGSGEAVGFTRDVAAIKERAAMETSAPPLDDILTPLADVYCRAMDALDAAGTGKKYMYFVTDGGENMSGHYSWKNACSTSIHDHPENTWPFGLDARTYWSASGFPDVSVIPAVTPLQTWLTAGQALGQEGRAYQTEVNGLFYDWAGGVELGSWEWNVYYRVATGAVPLFTPGTRFTQNLTRNAGNTDIIQNFVHLYENVSSAVQVSLRSTRSASASDTMGGLRASATASYSRTELDSSIFAGLAKLTGGRLVSIASGQPLPIPGDLNNDGAVDERDLRMVLTWFARPVDKYNPPSSEADLNNDGFVDNRDIALVRSNWTDTTKRAPIPGDIDFNWCVDSADLSQVMQWYGKAVTPTAQQCYYVDIDASGYIDAKDVAMVQAHLGEGCANPPLRSRSQ